MKPWLTIRNESDGPAEILIQGTIGRDWMDDSGMSEKEFTDALNAIPAERPITIGINSQGGSVKDGLGIYNAIKRRRKNIVCRVDGYALSIASVVALAGERTVSPKSSVWMIHDPWAVAQGDADDMRKAAEMLETHGETLASIYAEHTGKTREEVREAMKAETWLSGEEAVPWGLADEATDTDPVAALEAIVFDLDRFRHPPPRLVAMLKISGTGTDAGPDGAAGSEIVQTPTPMPDNTPNAVASPPAATPATLQTASEIADLRAQLKTLQDRHESERVRRVTHEVTDLCAERGIGSDDWLGRCIADETLIDNLRKLPVIDLAPPIVLPGIISGVKDYRDAVAEKKPGWDRINFMRDKWNELRQAEASMLTSRRSGVRAANTTSATIMTSMLNEVVTTILQDQLAPLQAFGLDVLPDPIKPLAVVVSKKVTAGGTAASAVTDFENETTMVATAGPISVTPLQYTAGGHLTNAELNSGYRMTDWAVIKASEIANAIWDVVTALFTEANYTAGPIVSSSAMFSGTDMATAWGKIQKAPIKNAVMDGNFFARLLGKNSLDFNTASGDVRTMRWPGWGVIGYSTRWSAAGTSIYGIFGAPQCVRIVAGIPLTPSSASRAGLMQSVQTTQMGISVQVNEWFGLAARTDWATYDLVFGAAVDDGTAGVLLKGTIG